MVIVKNTPKINQTIAQQTVQQLAQQVHVFEAVLLSFDKGFLPFPVERRRFSNNYRGSSSSVEQLSHLNERGRRFLWSMVPHLFSQTSVHTQQSNQVFLEPRPLELARPFHIHHHPIDVYQGALCSPFRAIPFDRAIKAGCKDHI